MKEEMNIEVDENDNVIGLRPRKDFYSDKYIHRSSYLLLLNSKKEILIQKRAPTKKWHPNKYTYIVCGTVANETYEETMHRRMMEEIGISIPFKKLFKYKHFGENDKAFKMVFIGKTDKIIKPLKGEIKSMKWISLKSLKKDLEDHPEKYAPPFVRGMEIFFEKYANKVI